MADRDESDAPPSERPRNGKLRIPLPFEEALKASTEVPADKLAPPPSKQKPQPKKARK